MPWKCCTQYTSKFGKLSSGHSTAKECTNYHTTALISHASKVMLKIFQAMLQQYMNCELPDVLPGFRKGRGTRDQIANIRWIIKKARSFHKNVYFCFIDYAKTFDNVDHTHTKKKCGKFFKRREYQTTWPISCKTYMRVKKQQLELDMDWFQIGKEVRQGCILSLCLFNLHAEYIMQNIRLDEAQLESRLSGEISMTSDKLMTPSLWQKVKRD